MGVNGAGGRPAGGRPAAGGPRTSKPKKKKAKMKSEDWRAPAREEIIGEDERDDEEELGEGEDSVDAPRDVAASTDAWNTRETVDRLPVKNESGELERQVEESAEDLRRRRVFSLVWAEGEKRERVSKQASREAAALEAERRATEEAEAQTAKEDGARGVNKGPASNGTDDGGASTRPLNAAALILRREQMRKEIARLAEGITSEPEAGVQQSKALGGGSMIKMLTAIASSDPDKTVRKLAVLSLVAVFKDILPGYRIHVVSPKEKEKGVTLSKQVRLLRQYEAALLKSYQVFLGTLHNIVVAGLGPSERQFDHRPSLEGKGKPSTAPQGLSEVLVAVRAMCTMLVSKPTFNFRENLLANVIPRMNSPVDQVRAQCCACVSTLLQEDVSGDMTLQIVSYISKFIRARNHGLLGTVHPDMCRALLKCDLKADLKDERRAAQVQKKKKAKKRQRKENDDLAAGLEESRAGVDELERHANQVEALRELFTFFLRVLKRAPQSTLMAVVLRGVARYVHLINLEIAQALVSALTDLVRKDVLSVEAGLQAVHTVAVTLRGPGSELKVDESEYVAYLYRSMLRLASSIPERDDLVPLTVRCVEAVFLGRKLYQHNRVAAVVTRMSVLALTCSPHAALALLACVRQLMLRYSSVCRPLLDGEAEQDEGGNSLALGLLPPIEGNVDPVLLQQDAPALWPLSQFRFHYHPKVREFATRALEMAFLQPDERPQRLFNAYDPYREGGFNPPIPNKITVSIPGTSKRTKRRRSEADK